MTTAKAKLLGFNAFNKGLPLIPAMDVELRKFEVSVEVLSSWQSGWVMAQEAQDLAA